MFSAASYMEPPCVASLPPKNKIAATSASPESYMVCDNVVRDNGWSQDMVTYPAHAGQWDGQVTWRSIFPSTRTVHDTIQYVLQAAPGPMPGTASDKQPTSVAPSHLEKNAASIAFTVSTTKGPTNNKDRNCPICSASPRRLQDRKRHISSHLPRWLQCQAPGCSWRGDRWEHLRNHRRKIHPSNSQESDTPESVIYDPWPLIERITDNTTFEIEKTMAIFLVEKRAKELGKSELWKDPWGRKRRRSQKGVSSVS